MSSASIITEDQIVEDVARMLQIEPTSLILNVPVTDQGLTSMHLIVLIEQWRQAGLNVDFHTIMSLDTVEKWITELLAT